MKKSFILIMTAVFPVVCTTRTDGQAPEAGFTASPLTGQAPLEVSFTDQSTNQPLTWDWSFGDGGNSTDQNPVHTYQDTGSFDVTLIVSNQDGEDTLTRNSCIVVTETPIEIEYDTLTAINMTLIWGTDDAGYLYVTLKAPTTGWVSVGFDPAGGNHRQANIIIGYVEEGVAYIQDNFGTGSFVHAADVSLGGTDDVSMADGTETEGTTEISFRIPLDSGDSYDKPLVKGQTYSIILAYGGNGHDDYISEHVQAVVKEIGI